MPPGVTNTERITDMKQTGKKKVILTLCKSFPVTHSRAGEPTGFEGKLKAGEKIHTIRYNAKGVWEERYQGIKSGRKYLSVRELTGRPTTQNRGSLPSMKRLGCKR